MDPCADASRGCAVIMLEAMVDGKTITEEEASVPGWIDAIRRREKSSTTTTGRQPAPALAPCSRLDRFRSLRLSASSPSAVTDLSVWAENILADVRTVASTIQAAPHFTTADSCLLHLWGAYNAVHRRWQAQKHYRRLRLRLARLALDMEECCSSLPQQQWGQTRDCMAGNLGLRDT
ncbi:hypothetical protein MRX96_047238 [Rhipicephalus microplus]